MIVPLGSSRENPIKETELFGDLHEEIISRKTEMVFSEIKRC